MCLKNNAVAAAKLLQSCLTLVQSLRQQPTRLPIPGILQARTLEWVAICFSVKNTSPAQTVRLPLIEGEITALVIELGR